MGDHADFGSWSGRLANDYEREAIQNSINNFYRDLKGTPNDFNKF